MRCRRSGSGRHRAHLGTTIAVALTVAWLSIASPPAAARHPGRAAYDRVCGDCHGADGRGDIAAGIVPLGFDADYMRLIVREGYVEMPPISSREISDEEVRLVTDYLAVLSEEPAPRIGDGAANARTSPTPTPTPTPNVVLFLVDDLGWSDVGVYGSALYETPNIDRLAEGGVRFTHAYAAGHVCSPTRASLMTGKYPARLGLTDWLPGRRPHDFETLIGADKVAALPLEEVTLAEAFKEHGYRTGHFGKWHLGDEDFGPKAQGFDVQIPRWNGCCPRGGYHPPYRMDGLSRDGEDDEYVTDRLTDFAIEFIEAADSRPFFLYLSHFAVHDPIQGRADLVEKYRGRLTETSPAEGRRFILEGNPDDSEPLTRDELDELATRSGYQEHRVLPRRTIQVKQHQDNVEFAAMVEAMDESLGRVLASLDATGRADETIVVFYSDNGGMSAGNFGNPARVVARENLDAAYATSNLPLRGAKGWLYEGGIRVPLIVRWPGRGTAGSVSEAPVITADLYPSLLEMAALPPRPGQHLDGASFVPAIEGGALGPRSLYWHFPHYSNHGMQSPGGAIRTGPYKLLEYFENGTVQLFDLSADIGELDDLSTAQPERAARMRAALDEWRGRVGARMPKGR